MEINFSNYSVLVVDDNKINIDVLCVMLENEGFQTYAATGADEALYILSEYSVHLILMDVMMPEMSGFELTEKLKSTEKLREIPILFITALDSPADIVKGFDLGACDYVTKPFNKSELVRRIKHQITLIHSRNIIIEQKNSLMNVVESRDRLYSIIAHDLRTPISSLKMILSILVMNAKENHFSDELIDLLYTGSDIAEQSFCLLDNLLKWTKSNLGMMTVIPQVSTLDDTVSAIIEVLRPTAKLKHINIELQIEDDISLLFDVDVMKSILRNLILNAIKFSHPSGRILVDLYTENNWAIFEIRDFGIGMSAEKQEMLRNSMYGISIAGTAGEVGTGLGLWIVRHFVASHQGEFYFNSKEGEGSCFGFKIPKLLTKITGNTDNH